MMGGYPLRVVVAIPSRRFGSSPALFKAANPFTSRS